MSDSWQSGQLYEQFMGRWSRRVAHEFLAWLAISPAGHWLDVGCGTGSLTTRILDAYAPQTVTAVDSSRDFIAYAQESIKNPVARFIVGQAQALELEAGVVDTAVSGLMLNFVPQPEVVVQEMVRVTRPGGTIGIFLWDYAVGMEMLRFFWDTAVALNPNARQLDEGIRFPLCREGQLGAVMRNVGLTQIEAVPIEITTVFQNFDDYWHPFLAEVGPAPGYVMSLTPQDRQTLAATLRNALPTAADGSISLKARAWAVKGAA